MPTHQDETLPQRYAREHQDYLKLCGSMTAEQVADLQLQLNNALAREQALQQRLTAADERADEAVTLLGIWQTWLGADRDSCDESGKLIWDRIDAVCGVSVPESTDHDATADLSCYFGLTYASWLTLPRVLMESMPERWKQSMARLLNEYDDAYTNQPAYGTTVRVTKDGKMIRAPEWLINYRHPDRAMIEQIRGEVHKQ